MQTVRSIAARELVRYLEAMEYPVDDLLRRAGLTRATLSEPDARLPAEVHARLWNVACEVESDVAMGLRVATTSRSGDYRPLYFLAASSATAGDALTKLCSHASFIDETLRYHTCERGPLRGIRMEVPNMSPKAAQQYALYVLAVTTWGLRAVVDGFAIHSVELQGPSHEDTRPLRAWFGCPVRFGAEHTCGWLTEEQWQAPIRGSSPVLLKLIEGYLFSNRALKASAVERVRTLLAATVGEGPLSLDHAARRLGMSARTLQRALRQAGTSFSTLVDQVRLELAQRFLDEQSWSLSELAGYLGFSDQSAFTRAYKRWTGSAPTLSRAPVPRLEEQSRER